MNIHSITFTNFNKEISLHYHKSISEYRILIYFYKNEIGLDIMMNRLNQIEFEDFLGSKNLHFTFIIIFGISC